MGVALLRNLNTLLVLKLALLVQVRQSSAKEEVVTLEPGRKGIEIDENTGKLLKVFPDTQAERLGLKPCQHIVQVGAQQYSQAAWRKAVEASNPF